MELSCKQSACCSLDAGGQAFPETGILGGPRYTAGDISPCAQMSAQVLAHRSREVTTLQDQISAST